MSRLNQIEELINNPEYDQRTHYLINNVQMIMGTNDSNELSLIYYSTFRFVGFIRFIDQEYVVQLLAGFLKFS